MRIVDTATYRSYSPCVAALGCFDGVHKGHIAVIRKARDIADKLGLPLLVFTFTKPPKSYFSSTPVKLVCPLEDKHSILESLGVDVLVSVEPSKEIFSVSAEDFICEMLLGQFMAKHIVCGFNYTFGSGGKGNTSLLESICRDRGVGVSICQRHTVGDVTVSSSIIRDAISNGNMSLAREYLGRPFYVSATVIDGQHLARRLGFPTVNVIPSDDIMLPKNGVYVTRVLFDGEQRYGITNVGMRPTVDTHILCAETHLFDFDGDLYGKRITVEFIKFIREETKFPSVEQMAKQIYADIDTAKEYLSK